MTVETLRRVALRELLNPVRRVQAVSDDAIYSLVTIRLYFRGATTRARVEGSALGTAKYQVNDGDLLVSRIDARSGAIAIADESLDGAVVTNDFLSFEVRTDRVVPTYLIYALQSATARHGIELASQGTTNRVRLNPEQFLALELPIPENLSDQRQAVEVVEQVLGAVTSSIASSQELDPLVLYRRGLDQLFVDHKPDLKRAVADVSLLADLEDPELRSRVNGARPGQIAHTDIVDHSGVPCAPLASMTTAIVDCVNDTPNFAPTNTGLLGLKTTNVRPARLDLDRTWWMSEPDFKAWNRRVEPQPDDVVLTREAPLGFVALLPEGRYALTQRLVLIRTHETAVLPRFLMHALNSQLVFTAMTALGRSAPPHLRVQDIPPLLVPLMERSQQEQFVNDADELLRLTDRLATERDRTLLDAARVRERILEGIGTL